MRFEGIYTPVVTPHAPDFSIDEAAFEATIEHLIAAGVHGLIVAGTTGEYYAQTAEERVRLMTLAKGIVGDRLPLIVGTGAIRTEDSVFFAEKAKGIGADALLVATPPYAYPTAREIALHALAVDRAANLPVMLYNYPGRMSVNMDAETLDRLGRSPNFRAIKESSGDPNRLHMLAQLTLQPNWRRDGVQPARVEGVPGERVAVNGAAQTLREGDDLVRAREIVLPFRVTQACPFERVHRHDDIGMARQMNLQLRVVAKRIERHGDAIGNRLRGQRPARQKRQRKRASEPPHQHGTAR